MKRFKNILLISDLKAKRSSALKRAAALAERNQADLKIVSFINDLPKSLRKIQADILKLKQKQMEEEIAALRGKVGNITCQILQGRPFVEIIRIVLQDKHDLVIIPAEGKSRFKDHIFGSTSMHLMRKCPCPVWVIKPMKQKKYFHILAAVDLSDVDSFKNHLNTKIMELASSLAKWDQSDLHIVYSWRIFGELYLGGVSRDELRKLDREAKGEYRKRMNFLLAKYGLNNTTAKIHINKGSATQIIPAMVKSHHIDLVVMGTVCRTGLAGVFIGNTAEEVLQQVNCSVLTVKPDGFVSPIQ
jgi:universal stress protein E